MKQQEGRRNSFLAAGLPQSYPLGLIRIVPGLHPKLFLRAVKSPGVGEVDLTAQPFIFVGVPLPLPLPPLPLLSPLHPPLPRAPQAAPAPASPALLRVTLPGGAGTRQPALLPPPSAPPRGVQPFTPLSAPPGGPPRAPPPRPAPALAGRTP